MTKRFTDPIGFSKLDTFRQCPARFAYQFIDKIPQDSSPALVRGGRIHEQCEAYLRGWIKDLPVELESWKPQLDDLKAAGAKTEASWGFDKEWNLLPNWFHKNTWLRAKCDAHVLHSDGKSLDAIDFKTGKYRVPSTEQVELYAVCSGAVYPEVEEVNALFWFIDTNQTWGRLYKRAHLLELRKKYEEYFAPIYAEEKWAPAPSMDCRYCPYSCSKNGPCTY